MRKPPIDPPVRLTRPSPLDPPGNVRVRHVSLPNTRRKLSPIDPPDYVLEEMARAAAKKKAQDRATVTGFANSARLPGWVRSAKEQLIEFVGEACVVLCGES